jgi:hypothetical protein
MITTANATIGNLHYDTTVKSWYETRFQFRFLFTAKSDYSGWVYGSAAIVMRLAAFISCCFNKSCCLAYCISNKEKSQ